MCPTRLKERIRRKSRSASAAINPITIVAADIANKSVNRAGGAPWNSNVNILMRAYTPTLVSSPANAAPTTAGGVGYDAGSQKNRGNSPALMLNAITNSTASTMS